jgi:hypothetical protein
MLFAGTRAVVAADNCSIWAGVVDEHSELSTRHEFSRMQNLFCKATSSATSSAEAKNSAISAGIPIPVANNILSLNVGANSDVSSSNFSTFHEEFCKISASEAALDTQYDSVTRVFSDNALTAAKTCYESNERGVHLKITPSAHNQSVGIEARYVPNGSEPAKVLTSEVKPHNAVSECDVAALFDHLTLPKVASCTWAKRDSDLSFTINTKYGSALANLAADPPLPPPNSGDVLQQFHRRLGPNAAPMVTDPFNDDTERKTWWQMTFNSRAQLSEVTLDVSVTTKITVATGAYVHGCTADANTTDPWRWGYIHAECGGESARSPEWQNLGRNLVQTTQSLSTTVRCNPNGLPVELKVYASPRGCSAMSLVDGSLTVREVKK